jgi:hypothetical protein
MDEINLLILKILVSYQAIFSYGVIIGMIGHYAKKKIKEETEVKLSEWFGSVGLYGTISSISAAFMAILGALSNGLITPDMSIYSLLYIGLTTGYTVDSSLNNDK